MSTAQDDDEPASWADYEEQYFADAAAESEADRHSPSLGLPVTLVCDYCGRKREESTGQDPAPDQWFCEECNGPMRIVSVDDGILGSFFDDGDSGTEDDAPEGP